MNITLNSPPAIIQPATPIQVSVMSVTNPQLPTHFGCEGCQAQADAYVHHIFNLLDEVTKPNDLQSR